MPSEWHSEILLLNYARRFVAVGGLMGMTPAGDRQIWLRPKTGKSHRRFRQFMTLATSTVSVAIRGKRVIGVAPTALTLARFCSTIELHPQRTADSHWIHPVLRAIGGRLYYP